MDETAAALPGTAEAPPVGLTLDRPYGARVHDFPLGGETYCAAGREGGRGGPRRQPAAGRRGRRPAELRLSTNGQRAGGGEQRMDAAERAGRADEPDGGNGGNGEAGVRRRAEPEPAGGPRPVSPGPSADPARYVRTAEDVLTMLDSLFDSGADRWTQRGAAWWDDFYANHHRPVPFFGPEPDESLASWLEHGPLPAAGRALDLGCGAGRNSVHLALRGYEVDAVDLSEAALAWAGDRAEHAGVSVRLHRGDAFTLAGTALRGPYDLICDSGCFHHLPPHRRVSYLRLLDDVLAPGGHLALTCFASGAMGSEVPDSGFYRAEGGLRGGLAYSAEALCWIFADLDEVELRRMHDEPAGSARFGEPFLWTGLFRRP